MGKKETAYFHAAARVAFLEHHLLTQEALQKAANAESVQAVWRLVFEREHFRKYGSESYEAALAEELQDTWEMVEEMTGKQGVTDVFRYPIDGQNLKVLVKNRRRRGSEINLEQAGGTISVQQMKQELETGRFETVPSLLGKAGLEAIDQLAKTGDPQTADCMIDQAVLFLMVEKAQRLQSETLQEYVAARIDRINLETAVRLLRKQKDCFAAARFFAEGGSVSKAALTAAYSGGYDAIAAVFQREAAGSARQGAEWFQQIGEDVPYATVAQIEGNVLASLLERSRQVPFGIEPVAAFLIRKERESRAIRLVLVSRRYGLPHEQTIERLRCLYGA